MNIDKSGEPRRFVLMKKSQPGWLGKGCPGYLGFSISSPVLGAKVCRKWRRFAGFDKDGRQSWPTKALKAFGGDQLKAHSLLILTLALSLGAPNGRAAGTVTAWGNNASGQTRVPFGLSNVVALAAG